MSRSTRKQRRFRACPIQALESRKMMAGDVSVELSSLDSRDLVITGDNSSNQILVQEVAVDRIRVSGLNGTLINGGSAAVTMTVRDDVTINMKGGNDQVTLRNLNQDSVMTCVSMPIRGQIMSESRASTSLMTFVSTPDLAMTA